jgi:hypothetical protein
MAARVKAAFEAEGYTLRSEYVKCSAKLEFTCPQGHDRAMRWDDFHQGYRCAECAGQIVTHEQVKAAFEAEGYILRGEYVSAHAKLEFTCPQGHDRAMRWNGFRNGRRCAECAGKVMTHERVKAAFEAEGYVLRGEYVGAIAKLEFTCPAGHDWAMSWHNFQNGSRCAVCAGNVVTREQVRDAFEAEGYTLRSEYVNSSTKLEYTCPSGHDRAVNWSNFQQGNRCAECSKYGYDPLLPATLYYIRFALETGWIYKIGITRNTINRRFSREKTPFTVIWQQHYEDGRVAHEIEQEILRKHKKYQYRGNALQSGNTECFTHDVLKLDRDKVQLGLFVA